MQHGNKVKDAGSERSLMISPQLVKELRERTGAGMMECKNALVSAQGDIELAITELRKKGQAKADKKAGRVVAEGMLILASAQDQTACVLVEVNCETDFVARDENFKAFAKAVGQRALETKADSVASLLSQSSSSGNVIETLDEARQALIGKIGENVQVRRLAYITSKKAPLMTYLHGVRIGVIIEVQGGDAQLAKDIAMHIAANNPKVISPSDVPAELIDKEKEIFLAQASQSGKPVAIIEKMVVGRINKFVEEVSLLGQAFVRDQNITVSDLLKKAHAQVIQFVRFEVGEGIEKKVENFAEEVRVQAAGG